MHGAIFLEQGDPMQRVWVYMSSCSAALCTSLVRMAPCRLSVSRPDEEKSSWMVYCHGHASYVYGTP